MSNISAIRLKNSLTNGSVDASQLTTLLSNSNTLSNFQTLLAKRSYVTELLASDASASAIFDSTAFAPLVSSDYGASVLFNSSRKNQAIAYARRASLMTAMQYSPTATRRLLDQLTFTQYNRLQSQASNNFPTTPQSLLYANGLWLVGGQTQIFSSTDGYNWAARYNAGLPVRDLAYANGYYIACINEGNMVRSSNGTSWSSVNPALSTDHVLRAVYGNGFWVALSSGGYTSTSGDNGATWNGSYHTGFAPLDIASGNGTFVAVGSSGSIRSSTTGTSWTTRTANAGSNTLYSVDWGNNLFVAVGANGIITTSPDGTTWTARTNPITSTMSKVRYINGEFIATSNSSGQACFSTDGVTWTLGSIGNNYQSCNCIAFGNGKAIAGLSNDSSYTLSTDNFRGFEYSNSSTGIYTSSTVSKIAYGNNTFVAVGEYGSISTSTDGIIWKGRTSGFTSGNIPGVVFANNQFVAVGNTRAATSPNGIDWTVRTTSIGTMIAVTYGNSMYVAVGNTGACATSPDGITWTNRANTFGSTNMYDVYFAAGTFVAVGASGFLYTSTDGITWTSRTSGFTTSIIYGVTYGDGLFVAAGDGVGITTSRDGITWTVQSGAPSSIRSIAYVNGHYVLGFTNNTVQISSNLTSWVTKSAGLSSSGHTVYAICYGKGLVLLAGPAGTISTLT